ncbi:MAG: hypothetical protein FJZ64_04290 [Chlamydiae bacterium]|nr:hypothetical protein [Chlamydiota bacterium]
MSSAITFPKNIYSVSIDDSLLLAIDSNNSFQALSLLNEETIEKPLPNGEIPLVYAVRKGKTELVEKILAQFPNLDLTKKDNKHHLSILEHAGIAENEKILSLLTAYLIASRLDRALQNPDLRDPEKLKKAFEDAKQKDPLKVSFVEWNVFAGILSYWISQYQGGIPALNIYTTATLCLQDIALIKDMKSWRNRLAWIGAGIAATGLAVHSLKESFLGDGSTSGLRVPLVLFLALSALKSYWIGKKALTGLSASWKNRSLEPFRSLRNAIVHSVIGITSGQALVETLKTVFGGVAILNAWDKRLNEDIGKENFRNPPGCRDNFECKVMVKKDLVESFLTDYMGGNIIPKKSDCESPAKICRGLEEINCIRALDPRGCTSHVEHIQSFGKYRHLALKYHSDKDCPKNNELKACEEAFYNIAIAYG